MGVQPMDIELDRFIWHRPASRRKGYAWIETGDDEQLELKAEARFKDYKPDSALFLDFAELQTTSKEVLKFTNRYGPLRERLEYVPLSVWTEQIGLMRQAVALMKGLATTDFEKIWSNLQPFDTFDTDQTRSLKAKIKAGKRLSDSDLVSAAVMRLFYLSIHALGDLEPEAGLVKGKIQLTVKHPDLLSFLWFSLGHAVLDKRQFKQCQACDKWFTVHPKMNRSHKTTCSSSCRFQLYRLRKKRAFELHQEGWTIKRIAKELEAEAEKVKNWINQQGDAK
jgi:hypothetical protein